MPSATSDVGKRSAYMQTRSCIRRKVGRARQQRRSKGGVPNVSRRRQNRPRLYSCTQVRILSCDQESSKRPASARRAIPQEHQRVHGLCSHISSQGGLPCGPESTERL